MTKRVSRATPPTICGIDAVASHPAQGMLHDDIVASMAVAKKQKVVIAYRPVEACAKPQLAKKQPTKNFHIKGKSSNWGPMAGFIPVKPKYSKLRAENDPRRLKKAKDAILENLSATPVRQVPTGRQISLERVRKLEANGYCKTLPGGAIRFQRPGSKAVLIFKLALDATGDFSFDIYRERPAQPAVAIKTQLTLTDEEFNEKIRGGELTPAGADASGRPVYSANPGGATSVDVNFSFEYDNENHCWRVLEENGEPLEVLAEPHTAEAYTVDYDLLAICPREKDYGRADRVPVHEVSHKRFIQQLYKGSRSDGDLVRHGAYQRACHRMDLRRTFSEEVFAGMEDPDMGNVSVRVVSVIAALNLAMAKPVHCHTVHHNVDAKSPATDLKANFPSTMCLPEPVLDDGGHCLLPEVFMMENAYQLKWVLQTLVNAGYHVEVNPLWDQQMKTDPQLKAQYPDWGHGFADIRRPGHKAALSACRSALLSRCSHSRSTSSLGALSPQSGEMSEDVHAFSDEEDLPAIVERSASLQKSS